MESISDGTPQSQALAHVHDTGFYPPYVHQGWSHGYLVVIPASVVLAAAGHDNYTKSFFLYLTQMEKLQDTHPRVYSNVDGFFVLRRTESYWAGINSDLYSEQVLMKKVKAVGDLTRGRGFDETTSLVVLLSTPVCAEVNRAMAGRDGSFVSAGACNLVVPDLNPGRDGYLSSWLCIYSAPNCSKAWSVQCCLWYCALERTIEVIRNKSRA